MPSPPPLQSNTYYHVFNRGNNRENLFREDDNYRYFLKLYAHHIVPVAETFAYCLMPNHFHMLIRTRSEEAMNNAVSQRLKPSEGFRRSRLSSASQAFSNLFVAYTLAFNKKYNRTGSLFEHPFHRIAVSNDGYFVRLVVYIHRNPTKHSFIDDFRDWPYSSYAAMLSSQPTQVERENVIQWFEGQDSFKSLHAQFVTGNQLGAFVPDDFD